ncbi:TetR/AcrR family transcriptional regulator [Afifella sp. JA880]|uniref:TetR/AcrR family transcriptional regulator n=1 Tax=Afifella sp. JA880 TaxID=2975280 RepID=UPI0021BA6FCC|nr:TetR/AcrR family transcriptional regulator [Afifella sp. JA880]MCT8268686.1 TetR/AcrR family transcriptional regulator [Afifella sp. JA880]
MAKKRGAESRERLVNAAADLFWQKGFAATSLAEIGAAAGVPLGNIYYYFRSKAALAEAVAAIMAEQMQAALEEIAAAADAPNARLTALVDLLSHSVATRTERGCPIRRASAEFRDPAPEASARAAAILAHLEAWLTNELARIGTSPADAQASAAKALILWQGGIALAEARRDEAPLRQALQDMRELFREAARQNLSGERAGAPLSAAPGRTTGF